MLKPVANVLMNRRLGQASITAALMLQRLTNTTSASPMWVAASSGSVASYSVNSPCFAMGSQEMSPGLTRNPSRTAIFIRVSPFVFLGIVSYFISAVAHHLPMLRFSAGRPGGRPLHVSSRRFYIKLRPYTPSQSPAVTAPPKGEPSLTPSAYASKRACLSPRERWQCRKALTERRYAMRVTLPGGACFFPVYFPSTCAMYWIRSSTLQE